ncbi:MAG: hypothetical protein RL753_674, partial [Bacteroidota bacterium]
FVGLVAIYKLFHLPIILIELIFLMIFYLSALLQYLYQLSLD